MTAPHFAPVDTDTADLLSLLASPHPIVGADAEALFLDACRRDAMAHNGLVSVNRVRALMADHDLNPRRLSAMWSHFTGLGKPMRKVSGKWEVCEGSTSGNDGRPFPIREWVG